MSTKSTMFYTDEGDNCYVETIEYDSGEAVIHLDIDENNIKAIVIADGVASISFRGDSSIAKLFRSIFFGHCDA